VRGVDTASLLLAAIVLLGVCFRAWAMAAEAPASWNNWDTTAYLYAARNGLFDNFFRPAGYPLFLRLLHDTWPEVSFTVLVQHLLGVGSGVLAYLTGRRIRLSRPLALLPAAAILINGDQIALEHAMLSESVFTPLLIGAVYCVVRASEGVRPALWLAAAGFLTAAMVSVRAGALPLVPVVALAAGSAPSLGWRSALRRAGIAGGAAALLVIAYAGLAAAFTGHFGITRGGGWALYARAAPFADCNQFTPPAGTEQLCETSAPAARPGPGFYLWTAESPAWRAFGSPPSHGDDVAAFGRTAILHQPLIYARYVASDAWRYVNADSGRRGTGFGNGPDTLLIDRRAPDVERYTSAQVSDWYGPEGLRIGSSLETLAGIQNILRFHGALVLLSLVLTALAVALCRGVGRWAAAVFGATALVVMLVPAATMVYHARYGVPTVGLLALGAALGVSAIGERFARPRAEGT
jgi:hypothetical protein